MPLTDRSTDSLVIAPPTPLQRKAAITVTAALLIAFAVTAPFATLPLPRINAFIPGVQAIVFVGDLVTAVLLFGHFTMLRTRAVLVIAGAYLFSAFIVVAHTISFPGAFVPGRVFGGLQTTVWLYNLWHFGFLFGIMGYVLLKDADGKASGSAKVEIAWCSGIVLGIVCAFTWIAAAADDLLPTLYLDELRHGLALHALAMLNGCVGVLVLAVLWRRRRSILDLWLMVVVCAGITEPVLTGVLASERFTLGFYASRIYSVATSTIVLSVLLSEMTIFYNRLFQAITLLDRERANKLMSIEAVIAAISHEVRQPLTAITSNSDAGLLFAKQSPPDMSEIEEILAAINKDSEAASLIFSSIRLLFEPADQSLESVDLGKVARSSVRLFHNDTVKRGVGVHLDIAADLPVVRGHTGQLNQVMINLIQNAIDAMVGVTDRTKTIHIVTKRNGSGSVCVSIEDTGCGIDSAKLDAIFDVFVTTKKRGMGLGLPLCRMIIDRHGGQISVSSELGKGTRFEFVLPVVHDVGHTE